MLVKKFNASDWQAYKAIRLEALAAHEAMYGGSLATESAYSDEIWQGRLSSPKQAIFGLYDDDRLIGTAAVIPDAESKDGRSAVFVGDYVSAAYQGRKLSHLLYEARIKWVIDCGHFNQIVTAHRQGNEASRRANHAFGFEYDGQDEKIWGDGSRGLRMQYKLRLAS